MFSYISSLFTNTRETVIFLLLAMPGRLMAISAHEFAHAWVADRCGDHTARNMGRLTVNPVKHLDLLGTIMMCLIGFGWARPVPVNPRNYRNYRKDDLKVSVAGIGMNLALFILSYLVLGIFILFAVHAASAADGAAEGSVFVTMYNNMKVVVTSSGYLPISSLFRYATGINDYLITPVFGRLVGYIYTMIAYFAQVNIVLAVFNLIPLPPLDGYHVLNDLLLRRPLFANPNTVRTAQLILLLLVFSGILGTGLSYVYSWICSGFGSVFYGLFNLIGLL